MNHNFDTYNLEIAISYKNNNSQCRFFYIQRILKTMAKRAGLISKTRKMTRKRMKKIGMAIIVFNG